MKQGKSTREAFGLALAQLGAKDQQIVVVDGDVHNSTRTEHFAKKFPERFFNVGIAESNMVGVAGGLAAAGKRAWCASFAAFVMCNAYDQLRMSVTPLPVCACRPNAVAPAAASSAFSSPISASGTPNLA